jgi:hypothetical protein
LKEEKNNDSINNSTLSLHIEAYENATEAYADLLEETKSCLKDLINKRENAKQSFISLTPVIHVMLKICN